MKLRLIAVALIMAACSPTGEAEEAVVDSIVEGAEVAAEEGSAPTVIEQCDAEGYRILIDTSVSAATLPEGPMLRVYGENDIITQEYLPRRTNVVYDARKVVRNVYCG